MTQDLKFTVENRVATITLNRPDKRNAFTMDMIAAWTQALEECKRNDDIHVIVVTGAGDKAFCAGGDIGGMEEDRSPYARKQKLWANIHRIPLLLEEIDKPVIAAVNGLAYGAGMDMALMCDMRIAAESARFCEAYIKVGLVPGDGGAYYLSRLVGIAKALELFWTGDTLSAKEAEHFGIVNKVVPDAELMSYTYAFAQKLANSATLAIRMVKRAVYQGAKTDLKSALDLISAHLAILGTTEDHAEALRAFREKRDPVFKGK
jgi:2-(1,2-epoxy-1,2-dihydrophenyl)acetyl-CoA isomerase